MENNNERNFSKSGRKSGLIFAILLILIGAILIAGNFGTLPSNFNRILLSWQMLLIIIGIATMFHRHIFNGLFCISIGGFFMVPRLAEVFPEFFLWVNSSFVSTYWPVLLIVAGFLLILRLIIKPKKKKWNHHQYSNSNRRKYPKNRHSDRGIERNSIFGDGEHIILDPVFYGGEMNAVFGGITLDLRKTSLPEGETFLEVNAIFGGVTIFVPEGWNVDIAIDSIFGGFKDSRAVQNPDSIDLTRRLVINGGCIFGGGELKN